MHLRNPVTDLERIELMSMLSALWERQESLGWTDVRLAEMTGFDPTLISRMRLGKHVPNLLTVYRLARAMGLGYVAVKVG